MAARNPQQAGTTNVQPAQQPSQRPVGVNGSTANSATPRPADGKAPAAPGGPQPPKNAASPLQERLIRLLWAEANKGGGLPAAGRLVTAPPPGRTTQEMAEAMRILEARILRQKKIVSLVQEEMTVRVEVAANRERETAALQALLALDRPRAEALAKEAIGHAAKLAKDNEELKVRLEQGVAGMSALNELQVF